MKNFIFILICSLLCSCVDRKSLPPKTSETYFPSRDDWESIPPSSLGWNESKIEELSELLTKGKTRAFIVLKNGKIVIEQYFGKDILNIQDFDQNKQWYWASAGKTLTATLTGIAQQENKLKLSEPSSKHLGNNWTSLSKSQEDKITVWHQLSMTSGLDDAVMNSGSFNFENLLFKNDAGTRWAYHNAPYTLLDQVIANATNLDFETYFEQKIAIKIGMEGSWRWVDNNHVYFSTPRSMARFGLMILNQGKWVDETIINDSFVAEMTNPSQELNKSYGYLWWLNGKESYMLPQSQRTINGSIVSNGPKDMVMGVGKNGQYVCVVPSQGLVLIRMGESPDELPVSTVYLNEIWNILNQIIKE